MSEPSETSGRPQFPTSKQDLHSEASTINQAYSTRKSSQPSDDYSESSKSPKPRRRTGTTVRAPSSPHAGSSRSEQQSTSSPAKMRSQSSSSINYTRTGRISKAKKGLKVHNCECGRVCIHSCLNSLRLAGEGELSTSPLPSAHLFVMIPRAFLLSHSWKYS